jgi:hypothetical protein
VSHPEIQILADVVALLIAANTDAGASIYPSRKTNFRRDELPAIGVYMLEMDATLRDEAPRAYTNEAVMVCELWMQSGLPIDQVYNPLLALEWQVIEALSFNRYLVECVDDFVFTGTDRNLNPSGERTVGESLVSHLVSYNMETPAPASAVPFEQANTTYNPDGNTDPGNQPEDQVELEGGTP